MHDISWGHLSEFYITGRPMKAEYFLFTLDDHNYKPENIISLICGNLPPFFLRIFDTFLGEISYILFLISCFDFLPCSKKWNLSWLLKIVKKTGLFKRVVTCHIYPETLCDKNFWILNAWITNIYFMVLVYDNTICRFGQIRIRTIFFVHAL